LVDFNYISTDSHYMLPTCDCTALLLSTHLGA